MRWTLFLDDLRSPCDCDTLTFIARSTEQAKRMCNGLGMPSFISFDHDLGKDDRAIDFVKWLIEEDLNCIEASNHCEYFIPIDFCFKVHSANPIGSENIQSMLDNYLQYREKQYGLETICPTSSEN